MAASVDPLVVGRVIGDVVDLFVPSVSMSVYFDAKHVTNGCTIKPSLAVLPPRLSIGGHPDVFYTLVHLFLLFTLHFYKGCNLCYGVFGKHLLSDYIG